MGSQMPICINFEDRFWDGLMWDEDLSDTVIAAKDSTGKVIWEFKVHSIVLRKRSKIFKELITKIGETITFEGIHVLVLKKFIKYLYLGDIYIETWQEIVEFLDLAVKYEVGTLLGDLELGLIKFVTLISACDLFEVARRFNLVKLEKHCLDLIVRGAVIIFGTSGFQRLSPEILQTIIYDHRLNVSREVDIILYLICWARATALAKGVRLDDQGLFKTIHPLLRNVRFDAISAKDQESVPENIRGLVFPSVAAADPEPSKEADAPQAASPEKPKQPTLKPREAAKLDCLISNYALLLLRDRRTGISWVSISNAETLVLRFSVNMPIFLGGFLIHYKHNGIATARMAIRQRSAEAPPAINYPLTFKDCDHRLANEMVNREFYRADCYEPDVPVLMNPGEECNVYIRLGGATVYEAPRINIPFTSLRSDEGPVFTFHMDTISAVKKIHFLSACGRCLVSARD